MSKRRRLRALSTFALLALACGSRAPPSLVAAPAASAPPAAPSAVASSQLSPGGHAVAGALRLVRAKLDALPICEFQCCPGDVVDLVQLELPVVDRAALREVLASDEPAPIRALAAVTFARTPDWAVLGALDACVDSADAAGSLPQGAEGAPTPSWLVPPPMVPYPQGSPVPTVTALPPVPPLPSVVPVLRPGIQRPAPAPPPPGSCPAATRRLRVLAWSHPTLGELCLGAASAVVGRLMTREQYHAWRARSPDPRDSVEYWDERVFAASALRDGGLRELGQRSRELLVRVLLSRPGLDGFGVDARTIAEYAAGAVSPDTLIDRLDSPEPWLELEDPLRREAYAYNLLRGWRELLGEASLPRLQELWDRGHAPAGDAARAELARLLADALPERRRELLLAGLALPPNGATPHLLERLATEYADLESALLVAWFRGARADEPLGWQCRRAVLAGLQRSRPPALRAFRRLLSELDAPGSLAAAPAARALGCNLPADVCRPIYVNDRGIKGLRAGEEVRRAHQACLAALRRCTAAW